MGCREKVRVRNEGSRVFLAEFLGTFLLLLFGNASVAQSILSGSAAGEMLSINFAWGMAVTMGLYVSAGPSGGHLNPAVTVALSVFGRFPWSRVLIYLAAQYLGAFTASSILFAVYYDALNHFDGGNRTILGPTGTASIWSTYPKPYVSTFTCLIDQILGTALLLLCVLAITDQRNMMPSKGLLPISVGFVVFLIGMTFGLNCGYAINPARDLSPRIFTALAGWGLEPFSFRNYNWFWVPVIGPHIGAIVGAGVYEIGINFHWPVVPMEEKAENKEANSGSGSREFKETVSQDSTTKM